MGDQRRESGAEDKEVRGKCSKVMRGRKVNEWKMVVRLIFDYIGELCGWDCYVGGTVKNRFLASEILYYSIDFPSPVILSV